MMNCNYLRKILKERRLNESVESKNFIWFVGMIVTPFVFFDPLKFHQFGSTVLTETHSEYVWYAGGRVRKGTLVVADFEQVDKKIDASEFNNVKLNAKEMISPKLVIIPKTADGQFKFVGQSRKSLHINTVCLHREQRHRHQNCIYILENLPWNSSTSILTPSITGKTSCYNGTGFIDDLFFVKLVYSYTSDIINAGYWRFNTRSSINRMWEWG